MNNSEQQIPDYPNDDAVRHQAGLNFLLHIFLFPVWMELIFTAESTFTFIIGWLLFFLINTYGCYRFTQTKRYLKQDYPTTQNEKHAVLYDYRFYLDIKTIFLKTIIKFVICAVCTFIVLMLFQMNIFKIFMAVLAVILIPLSGFFLAYLYFQLPLFLANYYLIHRELNFDYEQLEYELRQINLQSLIQSTQALETQNEKQDQFKPSNTTEPTIQQHQSATIDKISDKNSIPLTALKTDKPLSELEILMKHLRQQFINLPITQVRAFNQLIEVLQYLETQRRNMPVVQRKMLNTVIQSFTPTIKHDLELYFSYAEDHRNQYQSKEKIIPNVWLRTRIEQHTQQLIEQTKFVYERDLNSFTDHQKFLDRKFTPITDFQTISLRPYTSVALKPKNTSAHSNFKDQIN